MQNYIFQQPEGWYQKFGRNFLASVHIAHIQRPPSFYLYFQRERTDDSPRLHIISLYTRFFISPEFEIVKFFSDTHARSRVGLDIQINRTQTNFVYVSHSSSNQLGTIRWFLVVFSASLVTNVIVNNLVTPRQYLVFLLHKLPVTNQLLLGTICFSLQASKIHSKTSGRSKLVLDDSS